ncbi:PREDICTED: uncharacterized protein LOC109174182 [Ipomoea nil]|uniref:uncharacterized protein LOC109174182 n=1 Tax=Ipomoea nil TaxID=35883 RepID=UPI000901F45F|nr:PREDICTED: uncharacterized protein LOC109174182 [Ipomoea nil]
MDCLLWNCQGASGRPFRRTLKHILQVYKPNILGLFEPKVSGDQANRICSQLGFSDWVRVEAVGFSGGIWVLWKDPVRISIVFTHPQFVLLHVQQDGQPPWVFAPVYGSPTHHLRRRLWHDLSQSKRGPLGPWLVAGDFNYVMKREETANYNSFSSQRSSEFAAWIQDEGLIDLGFSGPKLTWVKEGSAEVIKGARLDRALCNLEWRIRFPDASVEHLQRVASDHTPLLIRLFGGRRDTISNPFHFRFQAAWLAHQDLPTLVQRSWDTGRGLTDNIQKISHDLSDWNKTIFGNIFKRKKVLLSRLGGIQRILASTYHRGLCKLEKKLQIELEETLYQEELLWFQRSREDWITAGDRNTAFYHAAATVNKSHTRVTKLLDENGNWLIKGEGLRQQVRNFYISLFTDTSAATGPLNLEARFPRLRRRDWRVFNRAVTKDEVYKAVCDMKPFKAPGPDDLPAGFYQHTWETTGDSIFNLVANAFHFGELPEGLNDTLVALIPKIRPPETVKHFRPISLCNVSYKILTKTITNRLKCILPQVIGPHQSSFVPGRQITDNVLVYQEVMHTMKEARGKQGYMAIKLDLEKAYYRLSWDFIKDTLVQAGFNEIWVTLIMSCISTSRLAIIWNGERLDYFRPKRGIRQGDAMSPAIFVMCMERLSHLICSEVAERVWKGIQLAPDGPVLSHLCFADDMVLFTEASIAQVDIVQRCLDSFCTASGQKISLSKSQVYFSKNTDPGAAAAITHKLGIEATSDMGRYLGVPSIHGRVTCNTYAGLLERITSRLEGWKAKTLSLTGRVTLAKSVLNAIPVYTMQTVDLPKGICAEIEKRTRRFIWGTNAISGGNKMSLVDWGLVTTARANGGLGLRKMHEMNMACMTKLCWRFRTESRALWATTLATKYKCQSESRMDSASRRSSSNVWKGMCHASNWLEKGLVRIVRNGMSTRFWMDKWLRPYALYEKMTRPASFPELYSNVAEYWDHTRGWKWEVIEQYLPPEEVDYLAGFVMAEDDATDSWGWGPDQRGVFTVKSAYGMINGIPDRDTDKTWKLIWTMRVPARVSMFMWLVRHKRILTNCERARRHLTINTCCFRCAGQAEDLHHLFRGCVASRQIWEDALHRRTAAHLRGLDWTDWFETNLRGDANRGFLEGWPEQFACRIWWLWRWRNDELFNGNILLVEQKISWLRRYDNEVAGAFGRNWRPLNRAPCTVVAQLAWKRPLAGWWKLNVDGCCRQNGVASCGGVLRDKDGRWCRGFSYKIGRCSIEAAKAWGVLKGLQMARNYGAMRIILECDSKGVVESLRKKVDWQTHCQNIGKLCVREAACLEEIRYEHIYREQNKVADKLASLGGPSERGIRMFADPPPEVLELMDMDRIGASTPRRIAQATRKGGLMLCLDAKRRLTIKPDKVEGFEPPFMKFSPVVQPDLYDEILNMGNSEYLHYLKQLTFGPVLPPPGFEGLYQTSTSTRASSEVSTKSTNSCTSATRSSCSSTPSSDAVSVREEVRGQVSKEVRRDIPVEVAVEIATGSRQLIREDLSSALAVNNTESTVPIMDPVLEDENLYTDTCTRTEFLEEEIGDLNQEVESPEEEEEMQLVDTIVLTDPRRSPFGSPQNIMQTSDQEDGIFTSLFAKVAESG